MARWRILKRRFSLNMLETISARWTPLRPRHSFEERAFWLLLLAAQPDTDYRTNFQPPPSIVTITRER
jgi:hypothetical protein